MKQYKHAIAAKIIFCILLIMPLVAAWQIPSSRSWLELSVWLSIIVYCIAMLFYLFGNKKSDQNG